MNYKVNKTVDVSIPDGLSIRELMPYVGMHTYSGVKRWCLREGYKYARGRSTDEPAYMELMKSAPAGLTRQELADYLGVSVPTAANCASLVGYQCGRRLQGGGLHAEDWMGVNWEKPDALIASEMGCTRERIRQVRRGLRKPISPYHRQRLEPDFIEFKWGNKNAIAKGSL